MRTRPRFAYCVPKIGKGSFSPQIRPASYLWPGRSNITPGVRPSLCPGPVLQCLSYVHAEHANFVHKEPRDEHPLFGVPGLSGWGDAPFHSAMNFALTEFSGVHPVSKRSHLTYKLAHLT